jgi:hypothetical protein
MPTRRALALTTILCLLIGLLAVPRGPILVCRITGVPMAAVFVRDSSTPDSCCDVAVSHEAVDTVRYELASPGCCELFQDTRPSLTLAVPLSGPDFSAVALMPAPLSPVAPMLTAPTVEPEVSDDSVPRAPPVNFASPRAPPSSPDC